ncbi:MAG: hypothetical protein HUU01_15665 [Saprospiraceae bacterium]|nr:hypothetical protein [Saprospiraceae bacterium]
MKKILLTIHFMFYASIAFLQYYQLEDLPGRMDFPSEFMHIYSEEQLKQILSYASSFDEQAINQNETTKKILAYMRSLLTNEQKEMVLIKKEENVNMLLMYAERNSGVTYSDEQKKSGLAYYLSLPDSLLIIPKHEKFLSYLETIQSVDQKKIVAAKKEAEIIALKQSAKEWLWKDDETYLQRAQFEQKKLKVYQEFYIPEVEKLNNILVSKLSRKDRELLERLKQYYYTTLERLRENKLGECLDESGQLKAPNAHTFFTFQFKLVEIAPHLCIFWCFQYGYPLQDSSHMDFACKMQYLTSKYESVLAPLQEQKQLVRQQVREKIEALKSPEERERDAARAQKPTLNILAPDEFDETEDFGDLWLFDKNRKV